MHILYPVSTIMNVENYEIRIEINNVLVHFPLALLSHSLRDRQEYFKQFKTFLSVPEWGKKYRIM